MTHPTVPEEQRMQTPSDETLKQWREAAIKAKAVAMRPAWYDDAQDRIITLIGALLAERQGKTKIEPVTKVWGNAPYCKANRDGDCDWPECPQTRDDEPYKSGRSCPRPDWPEDD